MNRDRLQEAITRAEEELATLEWEIDAEPEGDEKIAMQAQKKQAEQDLAALRGDARGVAVKAK